MPTPSYAVPGLVLGPSSTFSAQVQDLQSDLRALGYVKGPLDGFFGTGTQNGVKALQYDLTSNNGASTTIPSDGSAPVAVKNYNNGSVTAQTGIVDQGLVACIVAMLADPAYPKLPSADDPITANKIALAAVQALSPCAIPVPFLLAVLFQESNWQHYQVPSRTNVDRFVTVGLDRNNKAELSAITSRGYGIGQYTLFHHPPTEAEVTGTIADPVRNVSRAIDDLLNKFNNFVAAPNSKADDRIAEVGNGPLRRCQFTESDPRFMKVCTTCLQNAGTTNIVAGVTPWYEGSANKYDKTQYHPGSYIAVPIRKNIPCDWPYAMRRYNGAGVDSFDYQAEVLKKASMME